MYQTALLFIFSLPSLFFSVSFSANEYYPRSLLVGVVVALMMAQYIYDNAHNIRSSDLIRGTSKLFCAVGILIVIVALSGAFRAVYFSDFLDGVFSMLLLCGIYLAARQKKLDLAPVLFAADIVGLVHIFIAHLQYFRFSRGISWIIPLEKTSASGVVGNVGYRGALAILIAICVINGVYLAVVSKKHCNKLLFLFLTCVLSAGLLFIGGRAALISLLCALAPWAVRWGKNVGKIILPHKKAIFVCVMLLLGVTLYVSRNTPVMRGLSSIGKDGSSLLRLSHYATTLVMIQENPFLGVGLGNYKFHYLEAQQTMKAGGIPFAEKLPWTYSFWAHNEYLHFAAEFGLLVFLGIVCVAFFWIRHILRYLASCTDFPPSEFIWGVSIVILLLVSSLFERPFHHVDVMIWFPFGCAAINTVVYGNFLKKTNSEGCLCPCLRTAGMICIGIVLLTGTTLYIHGMFGQYELRCAYNALPESKALPSSYDRIFKSLRKADIPLLTRDEAHRFRTYVEIPYFSALDQQHSSLETIEQVWNAIERLYDYFIRHPTLETFLYLQRVAFAYQRADLYRRIVRYMPKSPQW